MRPGYADTSGSEQFKKRLSGDMKILEIGTRRWGPEPTHHKSWCPDADWTFLDAMDGEDVDIVGDAHDLSSVFTGTFDAAIAVSVFEHVEYPWIVADELGVVIEPGGLVYIGTHQTFPLHGYPRDFFRFSKEALTLIFENAGFQTIHAGYAHKAQIIPPKEITVWDPTAEVWLNVEYLGQR